MLDVSVVKAQGLGERLTIENVLIAIQAKQLDHPLPGGRISVYLTVPKADVERHQMIARVRNELPLSVLFRARPELSLPAVAGITGVEEVVVRESELRERLFGPIVVYSEPCRCFLPVRHLA